MHMYAWVCMDMCVCLILPSYCILIRKYRYDLFLILISAIVVLLADMKISISNIYHINLNHFCLTFFSFLLFLFSLYMYFSSSNYFSLSLLCYLRFLSQLLLLFDVLFLLKSLSLSATFDDTT